MKQTKAQKLYIKFQTGELPTEFKQLSTIGEITFDGEGNIRRQLSDLELQKLIKVEQIHGWKITLL